MKNHRISFLSHTKFYLNDLIFSITIFQKILRRMEPLLPIFRFLIKIHNHRSIFHLLIPNFASRRPPYTLRSSRKYRRTVIKFVSRSRRRFFTAFCPIISAINKRNNCKQLDSNKFEVANYISMCVRTSCIQRNSQIQQTNTMRP